ncbi:MAG: hypothetical protein ACO3B4_04390 [Burkholderiaceae bacterium]
MAFLNPLFSYGAEGVLAAINFSIERDEELHLAMQGLAGKTIAFRLDMPGVFNGLTFIGSFAKDGLLHEVAAEPGPRQQATGSHAPRPVQNTQQSAASPDVTLWLSSAFFGHAARGAAASLWPLKKTGDSTEATASKPSGAARLQGIRIEGDAALAQNLVPLLEVLADRVSPLQLLIARSPVTRLAQKAVHYAVYDAGILVTRPEVTAHAQALRALRERIDRLEKRLLLL